MSVAVRAARGASWNVATSVGVRVLSFVGTIALTHFIDPAGYGEVSAAVVVAMSIMTLTGLGFPRYLIARHATPQESFQAFVLQAAATGVALALGLLFGSLIADWLEVPGLMRYLPGLALAALLRASAGTVQALLARSLRFGRLAAANGLGEVTFTATAVALAPAIGPHAIVAGNVTRAALLAWLTVRYSDLRTWLAPVRINRDDVMRMLRFTLPLSVGTWLAFAASRWDALLVARYFGPALLGQYTLAVSLAQTPIRDFGGQIGDVFFPAFAALPEAQRPRAVARAMGVMSLLLFPLVAGVSVTAPLAVSVAMAPRWASVGPMAAILVLGCLGSALEWPALALLTIVGRASVLLSIGVARLVVTLGSLALLGWRSPTWACALVACGQLMGAGFACYALRREVGMSLRSMGRASVGPLAAAGVMALVVRLLQVTLLAGRSNWTALGVSVLAGGVVYCGLALVACAGTVQDLARLLRRMLGLTPAAASDPA